MKHRHLLIIALLLVGVATACFADNYAARFNGGTPNDYISLGVNVFSPLYSGASGLSFEGWIKPASIANTRIFHTGIDAAVNTAFGMELNANGSLSAYARSGALDAAQAAVTPASTIVAGNWYHIAIVASFTSGNRYIRLYINGSDTPAAVNNSPTFANSTYVGGTPAATNVDVFGRYLVSDMRSYVGLMEEFRIWKYARTISEIQADMCKEISSPPANLIGYWKFNTGSGTTAYDSSASVKNGTLTSGTDWTDIRAIDVLASSNPAVAAASVVGNTAKHPIYHFTIIPALHAATLNQVDFTTGGTYAASDISNLKLWSSATNDISTASQVGSTISSSLGGGAHSFTTLAHSMTSSTVEYFWITADITASATPLNTINVSALTTSSLTFADGSKIGLAYASGDQTFESTLPIELSSFTAVLTADYFVKLDWTTQSETGVSGFYIYRGLDSNVANAIAVSPMIDATNTSDVQHYEFIDNELYEDATYYYWLVVQDMDGSVNYHGPFSVYYSANTNGNQGAPGIPVISGLQAIYPNPFNANAVISYGLRDASTAVFTIYNTRGQIVRSFSDGQKAAGNWKVFWNGMDNNGKACSIGVYYIKMQAGNDMSIRKAVLMK